MGMHTTWYARPFGQLLRRRRTASGFKSVPRRPRNSASESLVHRRKVHLVARARSACLVALKGTIRLCFLAQNPNGSLPQIRSTGFSPHSSLMATQHRRSSTIARSRQSRSKPVSPSFRPWRGSSARLDASSGAKGRGSRFGCFGCFNPAPRSSSVHPR